MKTQGRIKEIQIINLREGLQRAVTAGNRPLRSVVKDMTWTQLLNNCHPLYREMYAKKLYSLGEIDRTTLREYAIID